MLSIPPPMSSAERQRRFQARHPGYDRRRKAAERGGLKRATERFRAARHATTAAGAAAMVPATPAPASPASAEAITPLALPLPTTRLALPAPAVLPVLPALNDLASLRARFATAEEAELRRS